jgi:alkylhydroperoxidase family enzyme
VARIPYVDPGDPSADRVAAAVLSGQRDEIGLWNVFKAMANHPQVLAATEAFAKVVYRENSLTAAEKEMAWLATSIVNRCHY